MSRGVLIWLGLIVLYIVYFVLLIALPKRLQAAVGTAMGKLGALAAFAFGVLVLSGVMAEVGGDSTDSLFVAALGGAGFTAYGYVLGMVREQREHGKVCLNTLLPKDSPLRRREP